MQESLRINKFQILCLLASAHLYFHDRWEPVHFAIVIRIVCVHVLVRSGISEALLIDPCESLFDQLVDASVESIFLLEHGLLLTKLGKRDPALILLSSFQDLHIILG
jgi:hypothetical protein